MRSVFGNPEATAREMQGHFVPGRDKIVPAFKFGAVCKVLWPEKTAACLAAIADRDERTAKRWLSGEFEPPIRIVLAVMQKMFERE